MAMCFIAQLISIWSALNQEVHSHIRAVRVLCGSSETHVCLTMEYEIPPENLAKGHFCFHGVFGRIPMFSNTRPVQQHNASILL